ncbi:MAG: GDSL-type esterase/lipase family protein [Oscillospiraceae bacterium]|nr:GDSL-type esterase/lipase family protein [Oscillospiraceae bacterium]
MPRSPEKNYPVKNYSGKMRAGKKEPSLTPAIILINLLIVGILILLGFFIYQFIGAEQDKTPYRPDLTPPPQTPSTVVPAGTLPPEEEENVPESTTTPPPSITKATTDPPDIIKPVPPSGEFDKNFFANDLFIGDSITTGLPGYGFLPAGNVFAKVGLSLAYAASTEIDGETSLNKATAMKPERIFIMLGTNEIGHNNPADLAPRMKTFVEALKNTVPDSEIYILTIPPVTAAHEQSSPENMEKINTYNDLLKILASENGFNLIDICAILKDSAGYFSSEYAEADGLHFKGTAYKAILSYIQEILSI